MSDPKNIVFIDDDSVTNFLTGEILKRKGYEGEATFFDSASDALDYLNNIEADQHPDLIFLDIKMPDMDGFDFLDEYMKQGLDKKFKTKIFMLTSSVSVADEDKSQSYPIVSGFLNKPFPFDFLQEVEV